MLYDIPPATTPTLKGIIHLMLYDILPAATPTLKV